MAARDTARLYRSVAREVARAVTMMCLLGVRCGLTCFLFPEHLAADAKKQGHLGQCAKAVRATARGPRARRGECCDVYAVAEGAQGRCGLSGADGADSRTQTLLERYNPLIELTGEERIEATARRVGLNMPVGRDE